MSAFIPVRVSLGGGLDYMICHLSLLRKQRRTFAELFCQFERLDSLPSGG